ncbi:MAG: hypothetical protein ACJASX_002073 [Limisphaerales bacterium]|jgi:hypothetical protein
MPHLRGGGFGERDHQQFVDRTAFANQMKTALHERARLTRSRPGYYEDISFGGDGRLLLIRPFHHITR